MKFRYLTEIVLVTLCVLQSSCDSLRILTARSHKKKIESPESLRRFVSSHKLGEYLLLALDDSFLASGSYLPGLLIYNKQGQLISFESAGQTCRNRSFFMSGMNDLLENGDRTYAKDSILLNVVQTNPTTGESTRFTKMYNVRLEVITPYIRTIDGAPVNIQDLYSEYLMIKQFNVSGKSSITALLIQEAIEDVNTLKEKHGDRITIVLLSLDQLSWMR